MPSPATSAASLAPRPFATSVAQLDDPSYADWIGPPAEHTPIEGLFLFRKVLELPDVPSTFVVHVSADPRYKLYVNGTFLAMGPAAGDLDHWRYTSLDLAPHLVPGRNVIALEVWNPGRYADARQISRETAIILRGPNLPSGPLVTDDSWKVLTDPGWSPLPMDQATVGGGYISAATDHWVAAAHPWGWTNSAFDDDGWPRARVIGKGIHQGLNTWGGTRWHLEPRPIPLLHHEDEAIGKLRLAEGLDQLPATGAPVVWPIQVPPHRRVRLLFDRGSIVLGHPRLTVDGGGGATITLRYQEALFQPDGRKGDRREIAGKIMKGYLDRFEPDNFDDRLFEPAWVRVYRYLEVVVETGENPLTLRDLCLRRARYPFKRHGGFTSSDPSLQAIHEACWRTADVCALETYMDCPYYEQVQYVGDARIHALISLYVTGDDRLMRNAIAQFAASRQANGLIKSAHPTRETQIIPPFALLYISMVHDFHRHREDPAFVRGLLPGIRFTLEWFIARLDERDLLGPLPYWNHTDGGARGFAQGSPPGAVEGGSIQLTLLLAAALGDAADLFEAHELAHDASEFRALAARLKTSVHCFGYDAVRGLYAETPAHQVFSQHTNAYAILTGTVPEADRAALAERLVTDQTLTQASLYFQFYVFEALQTAGRGELILGQLDRWRDMLDAGLTSFPEHGVESRSDAHAWAAHPLYHLLASVAGVRPALPGFRAVAIRPALGSLTSLSAIVAHPEGLIRANYTLVDENTWHTEIALPGKIEGTLDWQGVRHPLQPGTNLLTLPR